MLGMAHKLGWSPETFWNATVWDLTTVMLAVAKSNEPEKPTAEQLRAAFRARAGHVVN